MPCFYISSTSSYVKRIRKFFGHNNNFRSSKVFKNGNQGCQGKKNRPDPLTCCDDQFIKEGSLLYCSMKNSPKQQQDGVKETKKIEVDSIKGNTFVNEYLILKNLGKGSFATVKLALNTENNCLYAIKLVSKKKMRQLRLAASREARLKKKLSDGNNKNNKDSSANEMEDIMKEIGVMKKLEHDNVVRLFEVIDDPDDDKLLMVMEFVDGGSLLDAEAHENTEKISEEMARRHFRDLIKGLEYLHFNNIIHRDLKPGNLLLTGEGRVKIGDFGTACYREDGNDMMDDTCGTRVFFSPEMCSETGEAYSGKKADVYATGVCLYMLIFGKVPFYSENINELFQMIRNQPVSFPDDVLISEKLKDLLLCILEKDPNKRATLNEIMKHDWVTCQGTLECLQSSCDYKLRRIETNDEESLSALTPSISHVFGKLTNKDEMAFQKGQYIYRKGDPCNGLYLIREGLCLATNESVEAGLEREISCDIDFATNMDYSDSGTESELSDVEEESAHNSPLKVHEKSVKKEVDRIGSLGKRQVKRGIYRRSTKMHAQMKQIVIQSYNDKASRSTKKIRQQKIADNGSLPRGPGCVLGVLSPPFVCKETVQAIEKTKIIFISNETIKEFFEGPDAQLQVRLLLAKLQKVALLRETMEKFAHIHSDFLDMEKLRANSRNI